jgi:hypothetical protein
MGEREGLVSITVDALMKEHFSNRRRPLRTNFLSQDAYLFVRFYANSHPVAVNGRSHGHLVGKRASPAIEDGSVASINELIFASATLPSTPPLNLPLFFTSQRPNFRNVDLWRR